ncbi:MAG: DNA methyltransferase, partial [bacterium]
MPTSKQQPARSRDLVDPRNRLNDLNGRNWLKFQKSWFVLSARERSAKVAADFMSFFTKKRSAAGRSMRIGFIAENAAALAPVAKKLGREAVVFDNAARSSQHRPEEPLDYVLIDLCDLLEGKIRSGQNISFWLDYLRHLVDHLKPGAYLTVFARNLEAQGRLLPWAWHLGLALSRLLAIKDEKIGCLSVSGTLNTIGSDGKLARPAPGADDASARMARSTALKGHEGWRTRQDVIYCLNFRREENDGENIAHDDFPLSKPFSLIPSTQPLSSSSSKRAIAQMRAGAKSSSARAHSQAPAALPPSWFVPKPPPREKNVLLHPAKFPESLVTYFLSEFSQPGESIFDPMTGTGSTIMAALAAQRHAYGIELHPQFHRIASERVQKFLAGMPHAANPKWRLNCGDAAATRSYRSLPNTFDYVLTSPPYWDMLRMKGAETQQKRRQAGLLQFYSDDKRDLGNRDDYEGFLA